MKNKKLNLSSICNGAIQDKIDRAFEKIVDNLTDVNTDQTKQRSLTLKIVFKPNKEDPQDVEILADVTASLVSEKEAKTAMFLSRDDKGSVRIDWPF